MRDNLHVIFFPLLSAFLSCHVSDSEHINLCPIRFDLIFLMLDPQDEAYDRRLAHHLVALYYQSEEQIEEEFLDMAVLKDYIAYARTYISPRLSEEASQALIEVCLLYTLSVF